MAFETIDLTVSGGVARLTLNRPDTLNAFNPQMIADTRAALAQIGADDSARAVLVTGAGRGFSAGADLASAPNAPDELSTGAKVAWSMEYGFNPMLRELAEFKKPTVAAVNGVAAGGGVGVALACDLVFAGRSASFVQVFGPRLALVPDQGCTWFLPRLVGHARARGLAMLGDPLPASQAEDWGLIWKCVGDDALLRTAEKAAERLAHGPTAAFAEIKTVLDASWNNPLAEQLAREKNAQHMLGDRPDFVEGVTAFLEKREPKFQGK